jgi:hypothetical protein
VAADPADPAHGGSAVRRIAGLVYGTIVVLAVLVAFAAVPDIDAGRVLAVCVTTTIVLWLAHVYAHVLAGSLATEHRVHWRDVRTTAQHEASIVMASLLPAAALALGVVGLVSDRTAFRLAFFTALAALAGQAVAYSRIEHFGRWATVATVGVNVAVGVVLAVLEVLVSH